jgi:hypothetical protein
MGPVALGKQITDFLRALTESADSSAVIKTLRRYGAAFALLLVLGFGIAAPSIASAQAFDGPGGSGSGWIQMLRGNYGGKGSWKNGGIGDIWLCFFNPALCSTVSDAPIADAAASYSYMDALRKALGVYSNALLIVASVILLYHLLIMTSETAHSGVAGGKRANQVWAPIRLVTAIGLLVPISASTGLNSGQYIGLQVIEWGSNMATYTWNEFLDHAGVGAGSDPTPHMPDTGSIAREAAKIGACMYIYNGQNPAPSDKVKMRNYGFAYLWGTTKNESMCGSVIIFGAGPGAIAGLAGIMQIVNQMQSYSKHFIPGSPEYGSDPGPAPAMALAFVLGTLESVSGGWNNGAYAGTGWVGAGAYFLTLAAGGSNRVSGTDTLPIIMGPQAEKLTPSATAQTQFYKMAEWIVGRYKPSISGGGADVDMLGNTVAGRKFVDLMLLLMDQFGVISGLWAPGSAAFLINLSNSPLAELVDLGHRMIRTALDFVGAAVELGVNEPQHAAYSALANSDPKDKAFGPKSGMFFATMAIPILSAGASSLMTMGLTLGIFLPLLPFVKFVLSVLTWLISVFETLICLPLLSIAFLSPYGEGFGGQKVEPGFYLILHAFLRPVMTIFGMIAALLLFNIAAHLITTFYYGITGNAGAFSGGMYVVAKIGFGMMYASVLYMALNSCLKVMDTFGRNATRWAGGQSHEEFMGDGQQAVSMAQQGSGIVTQGLASMAYASQSAGQMLASPSGGKTRNLDPNSPDIVNGDRAGVVGRADHIFGAGARGAVTPVGGTPPVRGRGAAPVDPDDP